MTKFSNAAYDWMQKHKKREVSSDALWAGLCETNPDLTTPSEHRKTPRTTCMRDLRKDPRFEIGNRRISLAK